MHQQCQLDIQGSNMCSEPLPTRSGIPPRILRPISYKSRVGRLWQGRGPTYDSRDTFHQALAEALIERASILPGNKVLDVATGTGMAALPAAKHVGLEGTVVGVDISSSMLDQVCRCTEALLDCPLLCHPVVTCSTAICFAGQEQG